MIPRLVAGGRTEKTCYVTLKRSTCPESWASLGLWEEIAGISDPLKLSRSEMKTFFRCARKPGLGTCKRDQVFLVWDGQAS